MLRALCKRDEAHADVVRHERAHDRGAFVVLAARVVDGVVEAVRAERAAPLELSQVGEGIVDVDHRGERGGVRRDDEIARQPALEREIRYAKGAVLIGVVAVANIVRRFRDAPRHAAGAAVRDLSPHGRVAGLIEQRERTRRHDEQRHQVLEHAAAPRHQRRGIRRPP